MESLQSRLNRVNDDIVQTLVYGKGYSYVNKDIIEFEPKTIDKLNILLGQRNLLLSMLEEEAKNP